MMKIALMTLLALLGAAAQTPAPGSRAPAPSQPPQTGPIPDYNLPPFFETTLPNGLRVVIVEDQRFPLVTVRLGFLAGSKFDPQELPGLAESTAALLTEGTRTRTSRQIAEELAAIGGAIGGSTGADTLILSGNALAEHAGRLLEILADVARNPGFPEDEVALRTANRKQELAAQRAEPGFLAEEKLAALLYGQHPYSRIAPTMESIDRMNRKAFAGFHQEHIAPNNGVLVLLGQLPARAETLKLVNTCFGSWQRRPAPSGPKPEFPAPKRQIALVNRPGSVQADIHVGRLAVTRQHPDYFPLLVANTVLGGGASSRMFENIREKQGFAYDAHSEFEVHKDAALFEAVTQVRNEVFEPALRAVESELRGLAREAPAAAEVERTQNFMSGLHIMRLQTQGGVASQLIAIKLLGLPNDYLEKYVARVRAVTPQQVQGVAARYMTPDQAALVVVGDAAQIGQAVDKLKAAP